jgi:putative ABC transport system permease protein
MATNLAWHNLVHSKGRTAIAIAGIVFAIVLMFMQLGFLEAVKSSATVIYDKLDFDICVRSKDYLNLADARTFPRQRLTQAMAVTKVKRAAPLLVASNAWRNPKNGHRLAILCLGVPSDVPMFRDAEIQHRVEELRDYPDALLIDAQTRPEYGPADTRQFGLRDHGAKVEINDIALTIAGHYRCGAGLSCGGAAIMSEHSLQRISPNLGHDQVSVGLIQLDDDADAQRVASRLRRALNDDVDVLTRPEVLREELRYWVYDTNYGLIFQLGVAVSLIVGTAIVYQVLVNDVSRSLPEYATLKAIGYSNRYLAGVILQQSLVLAVVGFACGCLLSRGLYAVTAAGAQIPVRMTWTNLALVFGLSVVMCMSSGLGAVRKAFQADPADLF